MSQTRTKIILGTAAASISIGLLLVTLPTEFAFAIMFGFIGYGIYVLFLRAFLATGINLIDERRDSVLGISSLKLGIGMAVIGVLSTSYFVYVEGGTKTISFCSALMAAGVHGVLSYYKAKSIQLKEMTNS